ncbi:MAG: SIS domain-containing protein [Flavobacteriales bacterium]
MDREKLIKIAQSTIEVEAKALLALKSSVNASFVAAVELLFRSKGRVIISGIGKSANIANKIVATLNSTGTPAIFMHAADAIHGDLGVVQKDDVVICISNSGNSPEIKALIPFLKERGNKLIAMAGNENSVLAKEADFFIYTGVEQEACAINVVPTASTTAQLAMGDAIAVCLLEMKNITAEDFAKFHPGGTLGKQLSLKLESFCKGEAPKVLETATIKEIIYEISSRRLGATVVLDTKSNITGIITDGDIRRMLEKGGDVSLLNAKDIMGHNPKTISKDELAIKGLEMLEQKNITQLIVVDASGKYYGMVHFHDLIREGLK